MPYGTNIDGKIRGLFKICASILDVIVICRPYATSCFWDYFICYRYVVPHGTNFLKNMWNIHIFILQIACPKYKSSPNEEIVCRTSIIILNSLFLSHTWFFSKIICPVRDNIFVGGMLPVQMKSRVGTTSVNISLIQQNETSYLLSIDNLLF